MSVYIETTNLPNIIKFIADKVLTSESLEYADALEAGHSPLASTLLQLSFVEKVYISGNFVAIQKNDSVAWETVADDLKTLINDAIDQEKVLITAPKEKAISVYVEITPNPNVIKLVTNKLLVDGIVEVKNASEASQSPLAAQLFIFPFVKEVFITNNYISITKDESVKWEDISLELREEVSKLLQDGVKVTLDATPNHNNIIKPNHVFSEDEEAIKAFLDEYVKPAVTGDGGNIELIEYDATNKVVYVMLQGACSGCPSSTVTLKNGIENLLKQMLPEKILAVEAING